MRLRYVLPPIVLAGLVASALGMAATATRPSATTSSGAASSATGTSMVPADDTVVDEGQAPAESATVPVSVVVEGTSPSEATAASGCAQGERQLDVERALAALGTFGPVTVDGRQSAADCAAIVKFQKRFGINPPRGRAGATTADVAARIAASTTEANAGKCGAHSGLVACVDLTRQTVWLVRGGHVVWGPTVIRTGNRLGGRNYATPAGDFRIGWKSVKAWSKPYSVWLPNWQQFNGGIGFHATTTYLHDGWRGSHGCVNLLAGDAQALYGLTPVGTAVHVFGRRPGT